MRTIVAAALTLSIALTGCALSSEPPANGDRQTAVMTMIRYVGPPEGIQAEFELPNGEHWAGPYPSYPGASEMEIGDTREIDDQEVDVVFEEGKWIVLGPSD